MAPIKRSSFHSTEPVETNCPRLYLERLMGWKDSEWINGRLWGWHNPSSLNVDTCPIHCVETTDTSQPRTYSRTGFLLSWTSCFTLSLCLSLPWISWGLLVHLLDDLRDVAPCGPVEQAEWPRKRGCRRIDITRATFSSKPGSVSVPVNLTL